MAIPAPLLDRRDLDAIVQQARDLAPFYVPEWAAAEDTGAGAALLAVFAKMLEGLARRLNEVPQKNFIAFLNMLGAKLLPGQPARVPLTFFLSTGAQEAVRIPQRSQAAGTPPTGGDPIAFETEQDILATPAKLNAIISVVPDRDEIFDHSTAVLAGVTTELFADAAHNLQEHSIYFAQNDLFDLKGEAEVTLQWLILTPDMDADYFINLLSWEWRNPDGVWVPSTVPAFHEAHSDFPALTTLDAELAALQDVESTTVSVQSDVENDARFPDSGLLLINDEILAYDGKAGNTFTNVMRGYGQDQAIPGASDVALHTRGAEVQAIAHPLLVSAHVATVPLPSGHVPVTITLRKDFVGAFSATEVSGSENRWLRCRTLRDPILQASPLRELRIDTIGVKTFTSQAIVPDAVFANDVPLDLSAHPLALYPFGTRPRITDTFYIASDDAFSKPGLPITLAFDINVGGIASLSVRRVQGIGPIYAQRLQARGIHTIDDLLEQPPEELARILQTNPARAQNILEATQRAFLDRAGAEEPPPELHGNPVLSWEYWNGMGWQVMPQLDDATFQLRSQGDVQFPCPENLAVTPVNGQAHHWIRVRIVDGDYGQEKFIVKEGDGETTVEPDASDVHPPIIGGIAIRYGAAPNQPQADGFATLDACLTFNNLTFTDHTQTARHASAPFTPFQRLEPDEQTLYLGFDRPPVKGPISLFFDLQEQAYTEDNRPLIAWEYARQPPAGAGSPWARLDVVDGTRRLTESGTIAFIGLPNMAQTVRFGRDLYWLRATDLASAFQPQAKSGDSTPQEAVVATAPVITAGVPLPPCPELLASFHPSFSPQQSNMPPAPLVNGIYVNTVWAIQAETIQNEILGSSRGSAGQRFTLAKFPVITAQLWVNELATLSEGERTALVESNHLEIDDVKDDRGTTIAFWIRWLPIDDLATAGPTERVYSIDLTFGQIQFGDGRNGMVPPTDRDNIKVTYQAGGGAQGNVAAGIVTALRTTIPLVDRVANPIAAGGGSDTETIDRALERGPQRIKHRDRAVTAEDFEWLTREASPAIARVKVLPTFNDRGQFETGWVTVIIVPESQVARPLPSPQLRARVEQYLRQRSANVVAFPRRVQVTGPTYVEVNVTAELVPTQIELAPQVEATALRRLSQFLHPLTGGYLNRGWEFGRLPCLSDFYTLLEDIDGVDHVAALSMTLRAVTPEGKTVGEPRQVDEDEHLAVTMPDHTLVYGETHTITVKA